MPLPVDHTQRHFNFSFAKLEDDDGYLSRLFEEIEVRLRQGLTIDPVELMKHLEVLAPAKPRRKLLLPRSHPRGWHGLHGGGGSEYHITSLPNSTLDISPDVHPGVEEREQRTEREGGSAAPPVPPFHDDTLRFMVKGYMLGGPAPQTPAPPPQGHNPALVCSQINTYIQYGPKRVGPKSRGTPLPTQPTRVGPVVVSEQDTGVVAMFENARDEILREQAEVARKGAENACQANGNHELDPMASAAASSVPSSAASSTPSASSHAM